MSDKTIIDRGVTTVTRPEPLPFDFDKETQKLELVQYYQYCKDNSLISGSGEHSRLSLIRKTFTHLGGSGSTSEATMVSWLRSIIPSSATKLETLWAAYFLKYALIPDQRGVTYTNLSVEAGYRKFLREFIGENRSHNDVVFSSEALRKLFSKRLTESANVSSSVSTMITHIRTLLEGCSVSEGVGVLLNRGGPSDIASATESLAFVIHKSLSDTVVIRELLETAGGENTAPDRAALADALRSSEQLAINVGKILVDTGTGSETISLTPNKVMVDSISFTESLTFILSREEQVFEGISIVEQFLKYLNKQTTDVVAGSDVIAYGMEGFGAESFNDYDFGA